MSLRPDVLRAIDRLAADNPTPFYVFDAARALSDAREWIQAAAAREARLFYAIKCNRHAPLLDIVFAEGFGAEVNVAADLAEADRRRVPPASVVLQGPAKTKEMLADALAHGHRIAIDSPEELSRVARLARRSRREARCLWRIRPDGDLAEESQRRFGMSIAEAARLIRRGAAVGTAMPEGFAVHLGTGLSSPKPYERAIEGMAPLFALLARLGRPARVLDAGGGFGSRSERRLDRRGGVRPPGASAAEFIGAISAASRKFLGDDIELLLEPGRALASGSLHLVARVLATHSQGSDLSVHVDASALSHARFVPRGKHPILTRPSRRGRKILSSLQGPLGSGLDTLADGWTVSPPREGDLIVIEAVGAYNLISANAWAGRLPSVFDARAGRANDSRRVRSRKEPGR